MKDKAKADEQVTGSKTTTWTSISYNWSTGLTTTNVVYLPTFFNSKKQRQFFESRFPGECLIALIPGDQTQDSVLYPLRYR